MQKIGFCDKYSLTQAVLNGTKTMTRRVEKGLETFEFDYEVHFVHSMEIINQYWDEEKNSLVIITPQGKMKAPTRYKLGEVVAVAQAYNDFYNDECDPRHFPEGEGWTNKMFVKPSLMPHQIQMTGVRIERLQDITAEDSMKEGIYRWKDMEDCPKSLSENQRNRFGYYGVWDAFSTPREAFASLINRPGVGRKGLWQSNSWTVVYQFKLVK